MDFILAILSVIGFIALLSILANIYSFFEKKKEEKKESDLSYRAQSTLHNSGSFLEQGELKNGWARVKLAERRYAYVRPWNNRFQYMDPDQGSFALYGLKGIFEQAEEFDSMSVIVQRKGQFALLGANAEYIIPFYDTLYGQSLRTSLYEIGNGFLAYHKELYDSKEKKNVESIHYIIDRSGKQYHKGGFKKAYFEDNHLVVINDYYGWADEKEIIDIQSGQLILPFHIVFYELENGKILFYSHLNGNYGWNVFDRDSQSFVFSKSYAGIAYLKGRNVYLLVTNNDIVIANNKGEIVRELPRDCDTIYNENFFKGSHSILDYEGNVIAELADGSLSFIKAKKGDSSYGLRVFGREGFDKTPKVPFQVWEEKPPLYITSYNYEDHTHRIIDLKGNTVIGPFSEEIEPEYSIDGELLEFKVRSQDYKQWHLYDLSGKHIKDEPYKRVDLFELDNGYSEYVENERILMDGYFDYLEEQKELAREFEEDDYDYFEGRPRYSYNPYLHPSSPVQPKATIQKPVKTSKNYLFFDTETTGLPLNYNAPITNLDNWPRLVQLSWILTDSEGKELRIKDFIIKPDGYTIPDESTKVHGISTEIAQREGSSLSTVLSEFISDLESADSIVGHNIDFDKKVIGAEFIRAGMNEGKLSKPTICTMKSSTDYCKIPGKYGYKWPTLQELYNILFSESFDDAHNSLNDIKATKKCFFELVGRGIIRKEF